MLISHEQLREIHQRTGASESAILRRLVGLHVRGAAGFGIDTELRRLGLLASDDIAARRPMSGSRIGEF